MITIVRVTRRPEFSQVVGCTVYGMLPFPVMDSVTDQCYLLRYYGTDKEIITGEFSKHNGMNYVLNLYIIIMLPFANLNCTLLFQRILSTHLRDFCSLSSLFPIIKFIDICL